MELVKLDRNEYNIWDELVENSPQGSIFSKSWYLDILGVDYSILSVKEKDKIIAGIVLAKNEINTYANPMLDKYLGVLLQKALGNRHKRESKEYKAMELIAKECKKIKSFDYYFHPNFDNWIPFYWNGFAQTTRYTYRISYKDYTMDEIYQNFDRQNVKNNINRAKKSGVEIVDDVPFDDIWNLVNQTFLRQGSKAPFNKDKLEAYVKAAKEKGIFKSYAAYNCGKCVAVTCAIYEPKSAYFVLNGIDIENMPRGINTYLIYKLIEYFSNKCDYFDFEGSMLPGVEPFYRKMATHRVPYMQIWNDNFFNYAKLKAKKLYKKIRYGR